MIIIYKFLFIKKNLLKFKFTHILFFNFSIGDIEDQLKDYVYLTWKYHLVFSSVLFVPKTTLKLSGLLRYSHFFRLTRLEI